MLRQATGNRQLVALVSSYFLALVADKAAYIGYLVYAYDQGGASATALTSILTLIPLFVLGPVVTRALGSRLPNRSRGLWHLAQGATLGLAAVAASTGAPLPIVIAASTLAVGASAIMLPGVAMLSPAVARSTDELVAANLWIAHANSVASLAAPFAAAVLLAVGGSPAVLVGTAGAAALAAALTFSMERIELAVSDENQTGATEDRAGLAEVRALPGGSAILLAGATHYALLTMVGIIAVVLARSTLDLGEAGPGMLNLAYGVGAFASALIAGRALRRRALTPVLVTSVAASGAAYLSIAAASELTIALVAYVILGISRVTAESTTRIMLQRISTPAVMAGAFAVLQAATGLGGMVGSALVQLLLTLADETVAVGALAGVLIALSVVLWPLLRRADNVEEIPLVEMALLRQLRIFAAVPEPELEVLARASWAIEYQPGEAVVIEGEPGEDYFAIVDGAVDVVVDGAHVRSLHRGEGFGEVALLADVPRTATITTTAPTRLLVLGRSEFLSALTGSPFAERAAWTGMTGLTFAPGAAPGLPGAPG